MDEPEQHFRILLLMESFHILQLGIASRIVLFKNRQVCRVEALEIGEEKEQSPGFYTKTK